MLRKCLACLLALTLLTSMTGALALTITEYGPMRVVNCEEWVSLRDVPGTGGDRLAKVPLGAVVMEAEWMPLYDQFVYCRYGGQYGYVLSKYLVAVDEGAFNVAMDETVGDLEIVGVRSYENDLESMLVYALDEKGETRWSFRTEPCPLTELDATAAFLGGTTNEPRAMVYSAQDGLVALDAATGDVVWTLSEHLGGGLSCAVAPDGTMYIGGFYGPDPVAIDVDGNVLWRADCGSDDIYWLYEIELRGSDIAAHYDAFPDTGDGWVIYGPDGRVKGTIGNIESEIIVDTQE